MLLEDSRGAMRASCGHPKRDAESTHGMSSDDAQRSSSRWNQVVLPAGCTQRLHRISLQRFITEGSMLSSPQAPWESFIDDLQCSNKAGVQMCPRKAVIWVKRSEAYNTPKSCLMCGTSRKLEMYNLLLLRWIWQPKVGSTPRESGF